MERKKLLNDYSAEELLKISEQGEDKEFIPENSIFSFIQYFEIRPGENPVKKSLLYKLYTLWCKSEPEKRYSFSVVLNLYFTIKGQNVYIDLDQFKLTQSAFNKLNIKSFKAKDNRLHPASKQTFLLFLKDKNILQGTGFITRIGLFYIYEKWALDNRKRPMSPQRFAHLLNTHFKLMRSRRYGWGIRYDDKAAKITEQEKLTAMIWGKKYRAAHGNRKNKKEEI